MIKRTLAKKLKEAAAQFPVVTVTGPRQSGKTTLIRDVFPRGFLDQFDGPAILDEVQHAPDLFSYIQVLVDEHRDWTGRFILTGSHNFLLLASVSQSLAGRCAVLHLMPFSLAELAGRKPVTLKMFGKSIPKNPRPPKTGLMETLFTGFYPRIHDRHLPPRDVRLCAGRCGQLLNLSGLASDCGVSHVTAKRWLSVLEASFIIVLLRPHYRNFGKRLIKSPKLYFLDTGLLCYLLQIQRPEELFHRAERGAVFESFVVAEFYKNFMHRGEQPRLYFWRDVKGHEVDVIIDLADPMIPVETKSGQTVASDFFDNLEYWRSRSSVRE